MSAQPRATRRAPGKSADQGANQGTRERLLDVAEELFAARGFNGVSVRDIVNAAGANLGAIPYHFGSKENLFKQVVLRRVGPIQAERHDRVSALFADGKEPPLRAILEAIVEPAFRHTRRNDAYRRLAGRTATDPTPEVRKIMAEIYRAHPPVLPKALRPLLPHLGEEEFFWRILCVYGAMFYVQADTGNLQTIERTSFDSSRTESALKYLVPFLLAGLEAPGQGGKRRSENAKRRFKG